MNWWLRLLNLLRPNRLDRELDEELQFHLDSRIRDNLALGMTPRAACADARRRFGNRTLAKERTHEMNIIVPLETIGQDLSYAFRSLRKSAGFTAIAVLTLALGIGATTAVFTIVNGVLLRPLPFPQPDRILLVSYTQQTGPFPADKPVLLDQHYLAFERFNKSFEQLATFSPGSVTLTGAGEAVRIPASQVTAGLFPVLRVNPAMGRVFLHAEERAGQVALLSDKLWRARFSSDPAILGKDITLDGVSVQVIGVMPAGFAFPNDAELWLPLAVGTDPHNAYFRPALGRLRPSVTVPQARAELDAFVAILPMSAADRRGMAAEILPLQDLLVGKIRKSLLVFMGAVAFVLLIACANVANLMLIRGTSRRQEIAVRTALGALRGRLIRQLLTESAVISLAASVCGILLAIAGVPALLSLAPAGRIPRLTDIHIDASVLAFALLVGTLTGFLFGLVPALQSTGRGLRDFLSQTGRSLTPRRERLRGIFVVTEMALALVLLSGAGLLLKSFLRMRAVDPGFRAGNVATMTVDLPSATYRAPAAIREFQSRTLEGLAALPGVVAAGAVNWLPFQPDLIRGTFHVEGDQQRRHFLVDKPAVTPDYFRVLGIRLLSGRGFTAADTAESPGVAIVTNSVARRLWPHADPIGRRLTLADNPAPEDWLTVVGVVEDVRQGSLTEQPHPAIYQPFQQVRSRYFLSHIAFSVRTAANPRSVSAGMRAVLAGVDRSQPASIAVLTDLIAASTAEPWFQARLISIFSLLALLLSAIGIYGVLACAVAERTHEIGIRMALGAAKRDITAMVLRRSLLLAAAGVGIGASGALAVTRVLARFLFDVKPTDPATLVSVALLLAAVAILAGVVPALRATRVDPLVALRWE